MSNILNAQAQSNPFLQPGQSPIWAKIAASELLKEANLKKGYWKTDTMR